MKIHQGVLGAVLYYSAGRGSHEESPEMKNMWTASDIRRVVFVYRTTSPWYDSSEKGEWVIASKYSEQLGRRHLTLIVFAWVTNDKNL